MTPTIDSGTPGRFASMDNAGSIHHFCDFLAHKWPDLNQDPQAVGTIQTMLDKSYALEQYPSLDSYTIPTSDYRGRDVQIHPFGDSPLAFVTVRTSSAGVVPETWAWDPEQLKPRQVA